VCFRVASVLRELGGRDRAQGIVIAHRAGLIDP